MEYYVQYCDLELNMSNVLHTLFTDLLTIREEGGGNAQHQFKQKEQNMIAAYHHHEPSLMAPERLAKDLNKRQTKRNTLRFSSLMSVPEKGKYESTPKTKKQPHHRPLLTTKIILLGDQGVGKTTVFDKLELQQLKDRAVHGTLNDTVVTFSRQHAARRRSSIGGTTPKTMSEACFRRDRAEVKMTVYDTAGQERYRSLTSSYYRGAHGCLIMFDVTQSQTFDNINSWYTDLNAYSTKPDMVATILVGCHSHRDTTNREVPREKAEHFAEHIGSPYFELSTDDEVSVVNVFEKLADMIIDNYKRHPTFLESANASPTRLASNERKSKQWCSC